MIWLMLAACLGGRDSTSEPTCDRVYYADADGDGFGDASASITACTAPEGYVSDPTDCDDTVVGSFPGLVETCDGIDNDCDGQTDEDASDATAWFMDADGDGHGDPDHSSWACSAPSGHVAGAADCDDSRADVHPEAIEICDGIDNDCDDLEDGADDSLDLASATTFYADLDGDGWGDPSAPRVACEAPSSSVTDATDCDDTDSSRFPGAAEVCNDGVVNDCDGSKAEAIETCSNLSGEIALASARARIINPSAATELGDALAGAGDLNGDGIADLIIGAARDDSAAKNAGAAYLMLGGSSLSGEVSLADRQATLLGVSDSDRAGASVAGAGDVNSDGHDDLLIGADGVDSGGSDAGAAYVVFGPITREHSLSTASAILIGENSGDDAGGSVAGVGDVSGDGHADLLIGAIGDDAGGSDAGAAYLVLGPVSGTLDLRDATARFAGETQHDEAGCAVSDAGDVNGDGLPELLIGACEDSDGGNYAGAVFVVNGSPELAGDIDLRQADAKIIGADDRDHVGFAIDSAGDVDQDGFADLLIGAYGEDTAGSAAGAAYLVAGPIEGDVDLRRAYTARLLGEHEGDQAGFAVAGPGDVDGDGFADLIVGASDVSSVASDAGAVYLVYGPISGDHSLATADATIPGQHAAEHLGWSLGAPGDITGNGRADFVVLGDDLADASASALYLFGSSGF